MWLWIWLACVPVFCASGFLVTCFGMGATKWWHESIFVPLFFLLMVAAGGLFIGIAVAGVFQAFAPFEVVFR